MSGKGKKKKSKGTTLDLNTFLSGGGGAAPPQTTTVSWAEEMENADVEDESERRVKRVTLPSAPRAARGPTFDMDSVPKEPPFTAFLGNLPFDVDECEIERFFKGLEITNIRIPSGKSKGLAYAEFIDRNTLIEALNMNGEELNRRQVRIDLANQSGGFRDGGGGRGGDRAEDDPNAGRGDDDNDWRRGPRTPAASDGRDGPDGRGSDRYGDRGGDRYGDRGGDRYGDRGGDRYGDRGGDRQADRDGRYGDRRGYDDRRYDRDRGGGGYDRDRGGYDRGGGYSGGHSGDRDRYGDRSETDNVWRRGNAGPPKDDYPRGGDRDVGGEPPSRPRMKLQPRTKPVESESGTSASSAIFGGAKPVDTLSKEREVEKRLGQGEESRPQPAPAAPKSNPFGNAKPVDTLAKERDIEERLKRSEDSRDGPRRDDYKDSPRRDDYDRRDNSDRRDDDRDKRDSAGRDDRDSRDQPYRRDDYDRRDGGYDRRDNERRDGGYDRRDGGYDRRDDGYDRRNGGYDRRDGGYDRRDGPDRRDDYDRRDGYTDGGRRDDYPRRDDRRDQYRDIRTPDEYRDGARTESERKAVDEKKDTRMTSPTGGQSEGGGRRRLNLQPKSKPVEGDEPAAKAPSIFGGAKPVNTAAREREIEEKLKKTDLGNERRSDGDDSRPRRSDEDSRSPKQGDDAPKYVPAPLPKENPWGKKTAVVSAASPPSQKNAESKTAAVSVNGTSSSPEKSPEAAPTKVS